MKRVPPEGTNSGNADEMLPEYEFDYSKARPNRFVAHPAESGRTIVLEPDIAEVFKTSDSVNSVLRALIEAMPIRAH